ncbi:hypothetical protein QAD02_008169 [Eretmocerus hayati]|uniref:Uncharacterized protein n=1 Tax=Eretmocerus hayati TaxID=131215 RepID=A0ACC2N847_9HYME|nr:hypothetical protein QAD02_008169 [Eretmocerus hayati]
MAIQPALKHEQRSILVRTGKTGDLAILRDRTAHSSVPDSQHQSVRTSPSCIAQQLKMLSFSKRISGVNRWIDQSRVHTRTIRRHAASKPSVECGNISNVMPKSTSGTQPIDLPTRKRAHSCARVPLEQAKKRPWYQKPPHGPNRTQPRYQKPPRGCASTHLWPPLEFRELKSPHDPQGGETPSTQTVQEYGSSRSFTALTREASLELASRPSTPSTYAIGKPTFSIEDLVVEWSLTDTVACSRSSVEFKDPANLQGQQEVIGRTLRRSRADQQPAASENLAAAAGDCVVPQSSSTTARVAQTSGREPVSSGSDDRIDHRIVPPVVIIHEVIVISSDTDSNASADMSVQADIRSARVALDHFAETPNIDDSAQAIAYLRSLRTNETRQTTIPREEIAGATRAPASSRRRSPRS